jgi:HSP20 family protein
MKALALTPFGVTKPALSNIMDEWFGDDFFRPVNFMSPQTNIRENDDHYLIELSIPGFTKDDLNIKVERNLLTISSTSNEENTSENGQYKLQQFRRSSFTKSFTLSDTIDSTMITAKCENGILSIYLPKVEEAKTKPPRIINIK